MSVETELRPGACQSGVVGVCVGGCWGAAHSLLQRPLVISWLFTKSRNCYHGLLVTLGKCLTCMNSSHFKVAKISPSNIVIVKLVEQFLRGMSLMMTNWK